MRGEPALLKALVIPNESSVTVDDVEGWLSEMHSLRLVERYEADGGRYLHIRGWRKNQRLDRQRHSDFPAPPSEFEADVESDGEEPPVTSREPVATGRGPVEPGSRSGNGSGSEK